MTDSELPKALARIEELERELKRHQGAAEKLRERAVDLEEEKQLLEKQIEGYAIGLKAFAANPKGLAGMVAAPAVAEELMRIIGKEPSARWDDLPPVAIAAELLEKQIEGYALGLEAYRSNPQFGGVIRVDDVIAELKNILGRNYAPMQRDKAMKGQLSDKRAEAPPRMAGDLPALLFTGPHRLPVPNAIRRHGGLGPVIIAAEYVANQWEMGNVPTEESLDTLCKAMKLYSRLLVAIDKARCSACGSVICTCPDPAA